MFVRLSQYFVTCAFCSLIILSTADLHIPFQWRQRCPRPCLPFLPASFPAQHALPLPCSVLRFSLLPFISSSKSWSREYKMSQTWCGGKARALLWQPLPTLSGKVFIPISPSAFCLNLWNEFSSLERRTANRHRFPFLETRLTVVALEQPPLEDLSPDPSWLHLTFPPCSGWWLTEEWPDGDRKTTVTRATYTPSRGGHGRLTSRRDTDRSRGRLGQCVNYMDCPSI